MQQFSRVVNHTGVRAARDCTPTESTNRWSLSDERTVWRFNEISTQRHHRSPTAIVNSDHHPDIAAWFIVPEALNLDLVFRATWSCQINVAYSGLQPADQVSIGLLPELRQFLFGQRSRFIIVHLAIIASWLSYE